MVNGNDMTKESRKEKLLRLSQEAHELDDILQLTEYKINHILNEIKLMNPNKKEIEEYDLQSLYEYYYI